jgi:hypothetical protein
LRRYNIIDNPYTTHVVVATPFSYTTTFIPLTPAQRQRLTGYLAKHPDSLWINQLKFTLKHGWLEQEQTIHLLG